jgi:uncharacterized protein
MEQPLEDAQTDSKIEQIVARIAKYLPPQGPLRTFVCQNTLHNFEGEEFFSALERASTIFGANVALPETTYLDLFASGRITHQDINRVLDEYGYDGMKVLLGVSKRKVIRAILHATPVPLTAETLRWRLLERRYLYHFHSDITLQKRAHIIGVDSQVSQELLERWLAAYTDVVRDWHQEWLHELVNINELRHNPRESWSEEDSLKLLWLASIVLSREVLQRSEKYGENHHRAPQLSGIEELVNPYLIKFTSAFLDAGLAHITIEDRSRGLLQAFFEHMRNGSFTRATWLRGSLEQYQDLTAEGLIAKLLLENGVPSEMWEQHLLSKCLILKGWAGLVYHSELGVDGIPTRATLCDFLAVRLLLEHQAELHSESAPHLINADSGEEIFELARPGLADLEDQATRIRTLAYHLFHAFQLIPSAGSEVLSLSPEDKEFLVSLVCAFDAPHRLVVWHKAYEWNLYSRAAAAIVGVNKGTERKAKKLPICQLVCCIDDREESFRRYLEEGHPEYETFGTAGFFGVDAYFHSLYERPAPFSPINVIATHHVEVRPKEGMEDHAHWQRDIKTLISTIDMYIEGNSRSLLRGWLLALGGVVALVPLSLSTLAPRAMHRVRVFIKNSLVNFNDEETILFAEDPQHAGEGRFTVDEMAHRVKTLLTSTGLARGLAPLVVIMGHGSSSTNNPFRSAYDCGACGGRPGRLNSRVFALMANRSDVRCALGKMGMDIPETTVFIAAFHNTCTDSVEYFDLTSLSAEQSVIFERFRLDVDIARKLNALERCRRFDDAAVVNVRQAIAHVESRAHHIGQPRPEYGHQTNAMCIIGRRAITRGLFLDRRAFLVSYDNELDPTLEILRNLVRVAVPVCMGINLQYFFSTLDNQKYGAGSKLPHNVTSLLGLMSGYCSDLRTGLPWQMVDIHEPTRLLVVVDHEPDCVSKLIESEPEFAKVVKNRWITLMAYAAKENSLYHFDHTGSFKRFESDVSAPQAVATSLKWVLGKKGHLDFVKVGA